MVELLAASPLLLFAVVAALGFVVGRVSFGGVHLGVAAVLFVGLAVGAVDERLRLPELAPTLGLALFVYTIGLASGPGFFASLRRRGLRDAGLALAALAGAFAVVVAGMKALGLSSASAAGVLAGALTSTPALAGVLERFDHGAPELREPLRAAAVVGYSVAYPAGVLGVLAAIALLDSLTKKRAERDGADDEPPLSASFRQALGEALTSLTIRVTRPEVVGHSCEALRAREHLHVAFGRRRRGESVDVLAPDAELALGDLVSVIGPEAELHRAALLLGEESELHLELDRSVVDFRRMFVSKAEVTERPLASLALPQRFGAIITRIRRGDVELLAEPDTELALGDRVRVVAPRHRMSEVSAFLGDSYKALGEIDVLTFSLGLAVGALLGSLPIPLPGGLRVTLGFAGGPLLAGLVLGRLGRTGPLVWTMPYSANLTLRQLGVVLFLAGVGTRSGRAFAETVGRPGTLWLALLGVATVATMSAVAIVLGRRVLRLPTPVLSGMIAGIETQPAALAFAEGRAESDLPSAGYASVFPIATLGKIVLGQLLVALFAR
jgi:putative transport protein